MSAEKRRAAAPSSEPETGPSGSHTLSDMTPSTIGINENEHKELQQSLELSPSTTGNKSSGHEDQLEPHVDPSNATAPQDPKKTTTTSVFCLVS